MYKTLSAKGKQELKPEVYYLHPVPKTEIQGGTKKKIKNFYNNYIPSQKVCTLVCPLKKVLNVKEGQTETWFISRVYTKSKRSVTYSISECSGLFLLTS